jgi:hypothetical protein
VHAARLDPAAEDLLRSAQLDRGPTLDFGDGARGQLEARAALSRLCDEGIPRGREFRFGLWQLLGARVGPTRDVGRSGCDAEDARVRADALDPVERNAEAQPRPRIVQRGGAAWFADLLRIRRGKRLGAASRQDEDYA